MEQEQIVPKKKKRRFPRLLLRIILWLLLSVVLLVGTAITLVFVYENEVKQVVIDELNKHLNAEVKIAPENINLTVIKTFPNAAIEFKEAMAYEALPKKQRDTLFTADLIALEFNLLDLFHKNYHITKIAVRKADLRLKVDKNGQPNYIFWKSSKDTTRAQPLEFKLEKILLEEVSLSYKNRKELVKLVLKVKETSFSGAFRDVNYLLSGKGTLWVQELQVNKRHYLKNKTVNFVLDTDVKGSRYTLKNTQLSINHLQLGANGYIQQADSIWTTDLNLKGKNIDIRSALSLLPESQQEKIKDYESDGTFYADAKLTGNLSDINNLGIEARFGVQQAQITYKTNNAKMMGVNLKGTYSKRPGATEKLELKDISALLNNNAVKGDFSMTFFKDPYLELDASGDIKLEDLIKFYPSDTITSLNGSLKFDVSINSSLNSLKTRFTEQASLAKGKMEFREVTLKFKNDEQLYSLPTGLLILENNTILVDSVEMLVGKSDARISGKLGNFILWLFSDNQRLTVAAKVNSSFLSLDELLASRTANTKSSTRELSISENINLSLDVLVSKATLDKFTATGIAGNIKIRDKKLFTENLSFETMSGDVALNGMIDASSADGIEIKGSGKLVGIDVNKLFYQLNNFGQITIQDKHLRGVATASIDFSTRWSPALECDLASIQVNSDIGIEQGELIDYKPLESLSKYVELKELQRIKFSTLQSHIDISNKTIFITRTAIKNSAMNMELFGRHTFNNEIDYHIKLALGEVLAKRPGKSKQLDEELALVENDPDNKRCVFLTMSGTIDNPVIKYDRKGLKEKLKQDIKEEKQNLKQILHEEFGIFKKDTARFDNRRKGDTKSDQKFQVNFEPDKKKAPVNKANLSKDGKDKIEKDEEDDF